MFYMYLWIHSCHYAVVTTNPFTSFSRKQSLEFLSDLHSTSMSVVIYPWKLYFHASNYLQSENLWLLLVKEQSSQYVCMCVRSLVHSWLSFRWTGSLKLAVNTVQYCSGKLWSRTSGSLPRRLHSNLCSRPPEWGAPLKTSARSLLLSWDKVRQTWDGSRADMRADWWTDSHLEWKQRAERAFIFQI